MITGIVDTTVILHLIREENTAIDWMKKQTELLAITPITWMEVMVGSGNRVKFVANKLMLQKFKIEYLTISDQQWAMDKLEQYQLSHNIDMNDCQIASVAYRLQLPLYTHNLRDMSILVGNLAEKPY